MSLKELHEDLQGLEDKMYFILFLFFYFFIRDYHCSNVPHLAELPRRI